MLLSQYKNSLDALMISACIHIQKIQQAVKCHKFEMEKNWIEQYIRMYLHNGCNRKYYVFVKLTNLLFGRKFQIMRTYGFKRRYYSKDVIRIIVVFVVEIFFSFVEPIYCKLDRFIFWRAIEMGPSPCRAKLLTAPEPRAQAM